MRIALDVESVLADSNEAALRSTDKLERSDISQEWNFDAETWQIFMGVTDAVWRHNPQMIPPEEPAIDEYVSAMRENNEVHVLTAREHVDEQIVWWLDEHNISYDSFESTNRPKWEYDYDIFIDDNPEMFGECRLLLRHQPWNADCDDGDSKMVDRIYSLAEATTFVE